MFKTAIILVGRTRITIVAYRSIRAINFTNIDYNLTVTFSISPVASSVKYGLFGLKPY
jgi:hypothetical protein